MARSITGFDDMQAIRQMKQAGRNDYLRDTAPEHEVIAERYTGAPCLLYTLDGTFDAIICGRLHKFATVRTMTGNRSIEVTWPLVERKMQGDKTFYAC